MADAAATLLLVDDHPLFHAGLRAVLQSQRPGYKLLGAADAEAGLEALSAREFDLVLLDIMLPGADGFEALIQYQRAFPTVPRAIISGREDPDLPMRASRSGASAFVSKAWPPAALVQVIDRVLGGECVYERPPDSDTPGAGAAQRGAEALTLRQMEVLSLLVQGKCNKEIGRRLDIADRTVRAHLTEIFQALGVHSRVQAVLQAQRMGFPE